MSDGSRLAKKKKFAKSDGILRVHLLLQKVSTSRNINKPTILKDLLNVFAKSQRKPCLSANRQRPP
jgi:hypothetical protein